MSNMSYCRWRNTSKDLADCAEVLEEGLSSTARDEQIARRQLIETAIEMIEALGLEVTVPEHEDTSSVQRYVQEQLATFDDCYSDDGEG